MRSSPAPHAGAATSPTRSTLSSPGRSTTTARTAARYPALGSPACAMHARASAFETRNQEGNMSLQRVREYLEQFDAEMIVEMDPGEMKSSPMRHNLNGTNTRIDIANHNRAHLARAARTLSEAVK